jgi:hypothetical protein
MQTELFPEKIGPGLTFMRTGAKITGLVKVCLAITEKGGSYLFPPLSHRTGGPEAFEYFRLTLDGELIDTVELFA